MRRLLLSASAVLLIAIPAAVSYRTILATEAFDDGAVRERLKGVPDHFGDWKADAAEEEDESAFKDERYPGFAWRYDNKNLGRQVIFLVRGGPSGPLVYHHQPDKCYRAIGFEPKGTSIRRRVGAADEFAAADYVRPGVTSEHLRIYWAWSGDGTWAAPDEPRFRFTGYPVLYRVYAIRRTAPEGEPLDGDPCEEFLRTALPVLNRVLFDPTKAH